MPIDNFRAYFRGVHAISSIRTLLAQFGDPAFARVGRIFGLNTGCFGWRSAFEFWHQTTSLRQDGRIRVLTTRILLTSS